MSQTKNLGIKETLFLFAAASFVGDYGYDAAKNRAVAVDSRALLEGMRNVYHLNRIVDEIEAARK